MNWIAVGLAVAGWALVLILWLTLPVRTARREKRCVNRLRNKLEPYLRMRAAELDLLTIFPETTPDQSPEQVVSTLCQQIAALKEHERTEIGVSDTLPIDVTTLDKKL